MSRWSGSRPSAKTTRKGMALLVVLVLVVVGGAASEIIQNRNTLRGRALDRSLLQARLQAGVIAADVAGRLKLVEGFASRPNLIELIEQERWPDATVHLADILDIDETFTSAAVLDKNGILRAARPADPATVGQDLSFRDYFTGALRQDGAYLSESFVPKGVDRTTVTAFSSAIRSSSGEVIGVLRTTVELKYATLTPFLDHKQAEIKVFDRKGTQLLGAAELDASGKGSDAVRAALAGRSGTLEFRDPEAGRNVLAAYAPVRGVGWAVVVEEPAALTYAGMASLIFRQVLGALVVLAAALWAALYLARLLRQLTAERKRSETILHSIPDGVVVTDPSGVILQVNPAMEKLLGRSSDEIRGGILQDVNGFAAGSTSETAAALEEFYSAFPQGRSVESTGDKHTIRSRDGRTIPIVWTAAPIMDEQGELDSIVTVIRDVSREREADQLKAALVSTVSHELRTPLTMIQGFAELLMTREVPQARRQVAVLQIFEAARRLSLLIDDLLSVSTIESGRLVVEVTPVDVRWVIDAALDGLPKGDRERIQVLVDGETPALMADPDQLVHVVGQLLSNALKFSDADSRVQVSARFDPPVVELAVRDEGQGLSPQDQSQVFDKFFRGDNRDTRETPGTGLGLYITKNLVEMQGGDIRVESEPDGGSTFYVCLPAAGAPATLAAAGSGSS